ncbi:MAG: phosphoribosylformylglycinamidine synthase, purS protein [Rickettsiales bacterium]|nr:phosphoribosylformylglycinamidine synthase, purS protein [Rickettsiales bacterium]|tara:strand:- start:155 stop:385 length:231 start_codon:yes stop_codon:yes gene_type:complete
MKYRVFITFKNGILDPESEAIKKTIHNIGYKNLKNISRGKFFDIELKKKSEKTINDITKEILSNPVIEDFKIKIID